MTDPRRKARTMTQKRAQSLAIAYHGFFEARDRGNHNGVIVWATSLIEAQNAVGFELLDDDLLRDFIRWARIALDKAEVAA